MTRISNSLSKLLRSNRVLAILSLVASFIIWFNLFQVNNPVTTRVIGNVPVIFKVSPALAADGYEVIQNSEITLDVTVSGKYDVISALSPNDVNITANVTGQGVNTWTLDGSNNKNFSVKDMSLTQVTVMTDVFNREGEIFDVTAKASNVSAPEGLIADAAKITNSDEAQIRITGAQSVIDSVASVVAFADVNQLIKETADFDGSIHLFDSNGNEIKSDYIFTEFDKATVTVPISMKKEVPVVVTFANAPDKNPIKATTDVSTVTVKGAPSVIEKLKSVDLEPIDFADITPTSTVFTQSIVMPESVESSDGIVEVTVTLDLGGFSSRTVIVDNSCFSPKNVTKGLSATMNSFSVTIIGPTSALRSLSVDDISVIADMSTYSKGEHSGVPVTVKVRNHPTLWAAGVYTADIKQS